MRKGAMFICGVWLEGEETAYPAGKGKRPDEHTP
jgi:hypothetical protein